MSPQMAAGPRALAGLEDAGELPFARRGTVRAPLRRLFPFSLFVAVVIGLAVGTVYITENACAELQGRVQLQPWKTVQLKHASGEVIVYTLSTSTQGGD